MLVNYRGADDTITCLRAFDDVEWPTDRLELIVVDNDSGDGSAERIRAALPHEYAESRHLAEAAQRVV